MILVTGATGLVGSFIVRELIHQKFPIRILKRPHSDLSLLKDIASRVTIYDGDILDIPSIEKAVKGVDAIINCAGFISFSPGEINKVYKTNVEGTANLVNVAINHSIRKFVHISSVAAIGKSKKSGQIEIDENSKWEENNIGNYARSKYLSELEVWRGASEGLNVGILNPSIIIGPGNWNSGSTALFKYVWDKKLFYSKGNLNYVDVRDVSLSVVRLLESNIKGERFILNGGTTDYFSFFSTIASCFGKPAPSINISRPALNLLSNLESIRSYLSNSKPLISKESIAGAFSESIYTNKKAKEILNLTFKEINESVEWTCLELAKKYNLQIKN